MAANGSSPPPSVDTSLDFHQMDPTTTAFLSDNVSKAIKAVVPDYIPEKEVLILECQISFSSLLSSADLEAHRLAFSRVDLPLTHPEMLIFCQSYAFVDTSFVSKLTKIDAASHYLVMLGVGKVMGMFLAFPSGQIPKVAYEYMVTLERLTRLVAKAVGIELALLEKIVANSQSVAQPLLSPQSREQLLRRLKRRRSSTAELAMGNRSMELLVDFVPNEESDPSFFV